MKKIKAVLLYEFREIFSKSKILLMLFFVVILYESIFFTLRSLCNDTGLVLGVFEPFILICSKNTNVMLIPILYVLIISGFPYCKVDYFRISRIGKKAWLCGELLFVTVFAFVMVSVLAIGTVIPIMQNIAPIANEWSSFMVDFRSGFPELYMENTHLCLDMAYTLHGTPIFEGFYCFVVMWLNLSIIGVFILLGTVVGKQLPFLAVAVAGAIIGCGSIYFAGALKWIFPIVHTQYGLHFNAVFSGNNFPLLGTFIYLGMILVVEVFACGFLLKKMKKF